MNSKVRAGDDATPEGRYRITQVRGPNQTRYYRALMLDYPNAEDLARFRKLKRAGRVSRRDDVGSLIEIHGHGGRSQDWTKGCVALDNDDMDDLVPRVRVGTAVTIVGTIPEDLLP
jgi:murein L,D-transpeptidase YafK